jgi:hypothetical protein
MIGTTGNRGEHWRAWLHPRRRYSNYTSLTADRKLWRIACSVPRPAVSQTLENCGGRTASVALRLTLHRSPSANYNVGMPLDPNDVALAASLILGMLTTLAIVRTSKAKD